jgi:DNA modification methylase
MLYNEECLEGMKKIVDGSVDMIATDPPYCVGASSNGVKSSFVDLNMIRPFWEQCYDEWRRVELMERMIRNSTGEGDTVLDCFAGSGTTGVACVNTNRRFIGFELDKDYYEIAVRRLESARSAKAQALF